MSLAKKKKNAIHQTKNASQQLQKCKSLKKNTSHQQTKVQVTGKKMQVSPKNSSHQHVVKRTESHLPNKCNLRKI